MGLFLIFFSLFLIITNNNNNIKLNKSVPCGKDVCNGKMVRMKGHEAYNTSENSTIQCDGCRRKVPGKETMFHCPKQQNLFHPQGFDYCLDCADKNRDQYQQQRQPPLQQRQQPQQRRPIYNNNNNNNNNNDDGKYAEQQRTINRLRNELNESERNNQRLKSNKNELENRIRILQNDKDQLFRDKRMLNNQINDKLDVIDQQKEEIKDLKYRISNQNNKESQNEQATKGFKMDVERLQNDKLEQQNKYRVIKQKLDDKLDLIEQYKDDIKRLKKEKEEIINNYNQQLNEDKETPGKKNEISPTLKAIFTQKVCKQFV